MTTTTAETGFSLHPQLAADTAVVGDLLLWDNVALHHGRPAFERTEARTLQRVALGNYTAVELVPNLAELLARR